MWCSARKIVGPSISRHYDLDIWQLSASRAASETIAARRRLERRGFVADATSRHVKRQTLASTLAAAGLLMRSPMDLNHQKADPEIACFAALPGKYSTGQPARTSRSHFLLGADDLGCDRQVGCGEQLDKRSAARYLAVMHSAVAGGAKRTHIFERVVAVVRQRTHVMRLQVGRAVRLARELGGLMALLADARGAGQSSWPCSEM